jgi:hypothetical protein
MVKDFDTGGVLRRFWYFAKISPQRIHSTFRAGCSKLHLGHFIVSIELPLIINHGLQVNHPPVGASGGQI